MDQEILVERQLATGERLILLFDQLFPVDVAFWLKESESEYWYLYISSNEITSANKMEVYGYVHHLFQQEPSLREGLNQFRIKLIDAHDHRTEAALRITKDALYNTETYYTNPTVWGMGGVNAWFYPPIGYLRNRLAVTQP